MKKLIFLLIGTALLFSSCRKDVNDPIFVPPVVVTDPGILEDYEPTVTPITGSVDGFINDENGNAIQGATVKLGTQTTTTNVDGHFALLNVAMNKAGTIIQVTQNGYFDGSRRFLPTGNGVDRVRIQLLQKVFDQTVDGAAGGAASIPGGTGTIDFPANSIVDANGDVYTGSVDIAVKYLDPSAEITSQQMPGNLFGVNEELEERMLASYGMIAVELIDNNGNPLNLGQGTPATISMPVPASMQANAPATIPLWSYNEEYGVWVEEGEATLTNGSYVGDVSHFSWWNCDIPAEYVELSLKALDQNGNPMVNYIVSLTSTIYGTSRGFTNSQGIVSGIIPAGETLLLEVTKVGCVGAVHSQNVGPFTNPTNALTITANLSSAQLTTITGSAVCNGVPITNVIMKLEMGSFTDYTFLPSNFTVTQLFCTQGIPYSVSMIDPVSSMQSIVYTGFTGSTNNLGTIDACQNTLSEYITLDLNGTSYTLLQVYDSLGFGGTGVYGYYSGTGNDYINVGLNFNGTTTGAYPGALNSVNVDYSLSSSNFYGTGNMTSFDVTTFNTTDIIGTFSGSVTDLNGTTTFPISGSFDCDL